MHDARQHMRLPQGRTNGVAMRIAKFETLDKVDLSVRVVDISEGGVGIAADVPLVPGFVWFRDSAGSHKGGAVVWTRALENNTCRAGIKFIPLEFCQEIAAHASAAHPYLPSCHAPELIACMLVDEGPMMEG